ncbi:hypothetical protein OF83DRAFT_1180204 [Amylostereum chailletii]|nr:hypothetical protein OF83DRAFT_1180204 [Amylostereum chailletii]
MHKGAARADADDGSDDEASPRGEALREYIRASKAASMPALLERHIQHWKKEATWYTFVISGGVDGQGEVDGHFAQVGKDSSGQSFLEFVHQKLSLGPGRIQELFMDWLQDVHQDNQLTDSPIRVGQPSMPSSHTAGPSTSPAPVLGEAPVLAQAPIVAQMPVVGQTPARPQTASPHPTALSSPTPASLPITPILMPLPTLLTALPLEEDMPYSPPQSPVPPATPPPITPPLVTPPRRKRGVPSPAATPSHHPQDDPPAPSKAPTKPKASGRKHAKVVDEAPPTQEEAAPQVPVSSEAPESEASGRRLGRAHRPSSKQQGVDPDDSSLMWELEALLPRALSRLRWSGMFLGGGVPVDGYGEVWGYFQGSPTHRETFDTFLTCRLGLCQEFLGDMFSEYVRENMTSAPPPPTLVGTPSSAAAPPPPPTSPGFDAPPPPSMEGVDSPEKSLEMVRDYAQQCLDYGAAIRAQSRSAAPSDERPKRKIKPTDRSLGADP